MLLIAQSHSSGSCVCLEEVFFLVYMITIVIMFIHPRYCGIDSYYSPVPPYI